MDELRNIFKRMDVPTLGDPLFQEQFEKFCQSIVQNIERLISVQYTKGDPGDSVVTEEHTSNYRTGTTEISTGNLDAMGMAIVSAIFGDTPQGTTRTDLYNMLNGSLATIQVDDDFYYSEGVAPGMTVDGVEYNAIEDLIKILDGNKCNGIKLDIAVDRVNGEAFLASPYLFIDGRIQGLNRMVRRHGHDEEYYKTFHDFSTAVYGKATYDHNDANQNKDNPLTWNWTMVTVPIVPKLYFDQEINEFCWEVNGQQTGITAQGIKGDDGVSPTAIIAVGNKNGHKIDIETFQYVDAAGNSHWARKNPNWPNPNDDNEPMYLPASGDTTEVLDPKDGDIALVFFTPDPNDSTQPYQNAYMGRVYIGTTNPYVVIGWDDQGRLDIFESIREHDFWRMMVTINENVAGSPRGYILPAGGDTTANPSTHAVQGHIMYSERSGASDHWMDDHGFAALHVAPVIIGDAPNDQTKVDPTNPGRCPQTDHIGDMKLDYNVKVQGNHTVQGVTNVNEFHAQGNADLQGDVNMHKNVNVQGNVTVQGDITATNITATGKPFSTKIVNTRLASVSKFKDISYKVTRSATNKSGSTPSKISYAVAIAGTLEINIGKLSKYDSNNCIQGVHNAIKGYGPNWTTLAGENNDCVQSALYKNTGCRELSKMYDVVTYNIPFAINKQVTVPISYSATQGNSYDHQVFGFANRAQYKETENFVYADINNNHTWEAQGIVSPTSIVSSESNTNNIFCKVVGFKTSVESVVKNRGNLWYNDIDNINVGTTQGRIYLGYLGWPWRTVAGPEMAQGSVTNINKVAENALTPAAENYTINGRLHYAPLGIDVDYFFDLFTRIIESDIAEPKMAFSNTPLAPHEPYPTNRYKAINYDVRFAMTPVGCLYIGKNSSEKYLSSIWNAINTKNMDGDSLKDYILRGNSIGVIDAIKLTTPQDYTMLYPLVSGKNSYVYSESLHTNEETSEFTIDPVEPNTNINGPTGIIMSDTNINTDYIISAFDRLLNGSAVGYDSGDIESNCFDITPNIMVVSNNAKVCPNNSKNGVWTIDATVSPKQASWKSNEAIPVCVVPYEGYVGDTQINSGNAGKLKIGCASPRSADANIVQGIPQKYEMSLSGLLMYPYTPCLIVKGNNNYIDTMADGNNDASIGGQHYISTGRMMGMSEGNINGMASQITQQGHTWDDNPSVVPEVPTFEPVSPVSPSEDSPDSQEAGYEVGDDLP